MNPSSPDNIANLITHLEQEWDDETGFLGLLRRGQYDEAGERRFLGLLASLASEKDRPLDRRMVALLWFIPTFMEWQRERVVENGGPQARFDAALSHTIEHLMRLLGVP